MERNELDFTIKYNHYIQGGTREAGTKVREFLQHAEILEDGSIVSKSCVIADEFIAAVNVLLQYTFIRPDTVTEHWHCDSDCSKISSFICPGACNIDPNSPKKCPYFMDESDK